MCWLLNWTHWKYFDDVQGIIVGMFQTFVFWRDAFSARTKGSRKIQEKEVHCLSEGEGG